MPRKVKKRCKLCLGLSWEVPNKERCEEYRFDQAVQKFDRCSGELILSGTLEEEVLLKRRKRQDEEGG